MICPRINEPDPTKALALNVKSVKEEAKRLKVSEYLVKGDTKLKDLIKKVKEAVSGY